MTNIKSSFKIVIVSVLAFICACKAVTKEVKTEIKQEEVALTTHKYPQYPHVSLKEIYKVDIVKDFKDFIPAQAIVYHVYSTDSTLELTLGTVAEGRFGDSTVLTPEQTTQVWEILTAKSSYGGVEYLRNLEVSDIGIIFLDSNHVVRAYFDILLECNMIDSQPDKNVLFQLPLGELGRGFNDNTFIEFLIQRNLWAGKYGGFYIHHPYSNKTFRRKMVRILKKELPNRWHEIVPNHYLE